MQCPSCATAELSPDTRDMPYTYCGESIIIPGVTGNFCPVCGEAALDAAESARVSVAILELHKQMLSCGKNST